MRLVDFLIQVLQAHGETLKRLAALLGEDNLFALLEEAGDSETAPKPPVPFAATTPGALTPGKDSERSPYSELEGSVRELNLPEVLEFHLWAYPYYRSLIEADLDLDGKLPGPGGALGVQWVDEAVTFAETWAKSLPLPGALSLQAQRAAHVPWLRFRTEVLKRIGKRPMRPVY